MVPPQIARRPQTEADAYPQSAFTLRFPQLRLADKFLGDVLTPIRASQLFKQSDGTNIVVGKLYGPHGADYIATSFMISTKPGAHAYCAIHYGCGWHNATGGRELKRMTFQLNANNIVGVHVPRALNDCARADKTQEIQCKKITYQLDVATRADLGAPLDGSDDEIYRLKVRINGNSAHNSMVNLYDNASVGGGNNDLAKQLIEEAGREESVLVLLMREDSGFPGKIAGKTEATNKAIREYRADPNSNIECSKCDNKGHEGTSCTTPTWCNDCGSYHLERPCRNKRCRQCGETGHMAGYKAANCPNKIGGVEWCYRCNGNNHTQRDCSSPAPFAKKS